MADELTRQEIEAVLAMEAQCREEAEKEESFAEQELCPHTARQSSILARLPL